MSGPSTSRRVSNNSITPFVDEFGEINDRDVPRYNGLRKDAGVAELADAQDLKSWVPQGACGFDSRPRHSFFWPELDAHFRGAACA
jgi:hypothetical protein